MNAVALLENVFGARLPSGEKPPMQDPRFELMVGGALAAAIVIGFGGWSVLTRLDAAVVSPGVVRYSGVRQSVQTAVGGVISSVHVVNGDRVEAGQPLIEFSGSDALAQERGLAAHVFGLQAEIARLESQLRGQQILTPPPSFATLPPQDRQLADQALSLERAQMVAQRSLEASEAALVTDRNAQVAHQIDGLGERLSSSRQQRDLNQQELSTYEELLAKGYATKSNVLQLRRSAAALDGDIGATAAEAARLRTQAGEAQLQFNQVRKERAAQNSDRLRAAQTELQSAMPQWKAAQAQVQRAVVRAPVTGTVTALQTPAQGGVAAAGAKLLEIVPADGTLTVESRVPITDASELSAGQKAEVRLSLHGRIIPPLNGVIEKVSADSVEDEKSGQAFYVATVKISREELMRISKLGDVAGGIRPGMPVQVVVPTKKRSALDFMISPLVSRMSTTFTQR